MKLIDFLEIRIPDFENIIFALDGRLGKVFSKIKEVQTKWLVEFEDFCTNISTKWLFTGESEMIFVINSDNHLSVFE